MSWSLASRVLFAINEGENVVCHGETFEPSVPSELSRQCASSGAVVRSLVSVQERVQSLNVRGGHINPYNKLPCIPAKTLKTDH